LVRVVQTYAPQRVLSSPYRRCVMTVEPLARRLNVPVERVGDLAETHGADAVRLLRDFAEDKVAFCTHGDVITEVLVALASENGVDFGPHPLLAKGSVWVLDADDGRFTKATYIDPPD
jgi:broad specificity phosphatase PhoE